jgi:hypothetical protein
VDKQVPTITPWISSSAFKSMLLELITRGLHEREVNPIYIHWSLFLRTNRQLVSCLNWNKRKEWARTSSQQWSARKRRIEHPAMNQPNSMITLSLSGKYSVLRFSARNKHKIRAKESSRHSARKSEHPIISTAPPLHCRERLSVRK